MPTITNKDKRCIAYNVTLEFRLRKNIPSNLIYHILFGISKKEQNRHLIGAFSNEAIYIDDMDMDI